MDIKNKTATTETTPSAEDQLKALQAEVDKAKAEAAAATARAEKAEADAEAAEREKAAINANADAEVARQEAQNKIRSGHVEDFFPYPQELRFANSAHPPAER